jgi:hypothetical protein
MEWIRSMTQWAGTVFDQTGIGPAALPVAFLLGLFSAIASACYTLPLLGAIVGYSGTRQERGRGCHKNNCGSSAHLCRLQFPRDFLKDAALARGPLESLRSPGTPGFITSISFFVWSRSAVRRHGRCWVRGIRPRASTCRIFPESGACPPL